MACFSWLAPRPTSFRSPGGRLGMVARIAATAPFFPHVGALDLFEGAYVLAQGDLPAGFV